MSTPAGPALQTFRAAILSLYPSARWLSTASRSFRMRGATKGGHRIQVMITSDDQPKDIPEFLDYRHSPVGNTSQNVVSSASRLLIPVLH